MVVVKHESTPQIVFVLASQQRHFPDISVSAKDFEELILLNVRRKVSNKKLVWIRGISRLRPPSRCSFTRSSTPGRVARIAPRLVIPFLRAMSPVATVSIGGLCVLITPSVIVLAIIVTTPVVVFVILLVFVAMLVIVPFIALLRPVVGPLHGDWHFRVHPDLVNLVQDLDCIRSCLFFCVHDQRSFRPIVPDVGGEVNFGNVPVRGEHLSQLSFCHILGNVSNEELVVVFIRAEIESPRDCDRFLCIFTDLVDVMQHLYRIVPGLLLLVVHKTSHQVVLLLLVHHVDPCNFTISTEYLPELVFGDIVRQLTHKKLVILMNNHHQDLSSPVTAALQSLRTQGHRGANLLEGGEGGRAMNLK
mmetsp:Transcript_141785/g.250527  ORF Transcript_141785/g.250527 Transcript_141785/m.250527 type:complete len:361 (-) Transcript_141785:238-1320(-)